MAKQPIKIVKSETTPETAELLAASVVQVAEGFARLQKGALTQRAIIVLLQDGIGQAKISKQQIRLVLDNLPRLKAWYVKG